MLSKLKLIPLLALLPLSLYAPVHAIPENISVVRAETGGGQTAPQVPLPPPGRPPQGGRKFYTRTQARVAVVYRAAPKFCNSSLYKPFTNKGELISWGNQLIPDANNANMAGHRWLYEIARTQFGDESYWLYLYYFNARMGNFADSCEPGQLELNQRLLVRTSLQLGNGQSLSIQDIPELQPYYTNAKNERIYYNPATYFARLNRIKALQKVFNDFRQARKNELSNL